MPDPSRQDGSCGHRNLIIFFCGALSVATGLWMQRLAVGLLAWQATGSVFWLGFIGTADLLPSIVLGPPAGLLADRFDRKRLTAICQVCNVAVVLALFAVARDGAIDAHVLLLFALANGLIASVQQPVRMSMTGELVEKANIGRAVALMSLNAHLGRFFGPALLGPVIAFQGIPAVFVYCAAFYAVMVVLLPFLRFSDRTREIGAWAGLRSEFLAGFRYTAGHPTIGPIMLSFVLVSVFGRPVFEMLPAVAETFFGRGAEGLSWLAGAVGTGTVLCSLWLAHKPASRCTLSAIAGYMLIYAVAAVIMTEVTAFWSAVLLAGLAGFAVTATAVGSVAAVQIAVPSEIRGRVLGIYGATYRAAPALGAIAMGWLADLTDLRWPILIGAAICILWWLAVTLFRSRFEARAGAAAD